MAQRNIRSFRFNDTTKLRLQTFDNSLDSLVYVAFMEMEENREELQSIKQECFKLRRERDELKREIQDLKNFELTLRRTAREILLSLE